MRCKRTEGYNINEGDIVFIKSVTLCAFGGVLFFLAIFLEII